ncbi:hypothetical protein TKK_0003869 [Trichogramma kaykai]|uniref:Uncharacterized protein n=1 Tax=Trichogramma kaykai TaxID=54128 RepID=A0ABD2XQE4_9HYME
MDERRFDYNRNVISSAPDESLLATATWSSITVRRQHDNECSDNDETSSSSSSSLTAAKRQVVLVRRRKQQLQRYKCTRFPAAIMALLTGTWLAALFAASGSCFAAAAAFTTGKYLLTRSPLVYS